MRNTRKGRFRVWDRAQDAFSGEDLVYNFDAIDEIIGGKDGSSGPSGAQYVGTASTWLGTGDVIPAESASKYPGTTNSGYENQTGRRTLYSIVSGLNFNDVPLGTVIMWWRPNSQISIPDGWVACDGSTISAADHSFPTSDDIVVPDLRNKFVLGADPTIPGINATNYSLESGATAAQNQNNLWTGSQAASGSTGAPGIGYDSGLEVSNFSGSNQLRNISHEHGAGTLSIRDHYHAMSHTHTLPSHLHRLKSHTHNHDHVHLMPNHYHDFNVTDSFFTGQPRASTNPNDRSEGKITFKSGTAGGDVSPASKDHYHKIDMNRAGSTGERKIIPDSPFGFFGGYWSQIWGYSTSPNSLSSGYGYGPQAITSKPTAFNQSGGALNAHTAKFATDDDNGLRSTEGSGELTTNPMPSSQQRTGVIVGDSVPQVADSKALDGITTRESLYVNPRLQYVGMLFLMKVRVSTNII